MHACLVGVASLVKDLNNLICFSFAFCFLKIKMQLPLSRIFIKITTEIGERESTLAMVCHPFLYIQKKRENMDFIMIYMTSLCNEREVSSMFRLKVIFLLLLKIVVFLTKFHEHIGHFEINFSLACKYIIFMCSHR